jgi:hypothetical protein
MLGDHSETAANLLIDLGADFRKFSECPFWPRRAQKQEELVGSNPVMITKPLGMGAEG